MITVKDQCIYCCKSDALDRIEYQGSTGVKWTGLKCYYCGWASGTVVATPENISKMEGAK